MATNTVKVHVFNGSSARTCDADRAIATLGEMLGYEPETLRANAGGWVSHWTFRDAGTPVGRIEVVS